MIRRKDSEHKEQVLLFQWADAVRQRFPDLEMLIAIPNGGKRHIGTAVKMKKEGVKSGVWDVFLPVPSGIYHGLWIEMKSLKGSLSENQRKWGGMCSLQGYRMVVCRSWHEAKDAIECYLENKQ